MTKYHILIWYIGVSMYAYTYHICTAHTFVSGMVAVGTGERLVHSENIQGRKQTVNPTLRMTVYKSMMLCVCNNIIVLPH